MPRSSKPASESPAPRAGAGAGDGTGQTIAGIERALDVLSLFAETRSRDLGVTEIAQQLGLSKAVVHRILASFKAKGFIEVDEHARRYALGPKILFLGLAYLDRLDIRTVARQVMAELSRQTNETATVSLRSGWTRVYVDQVTPDRDVVMRVSIGTPYPLHAGASGKAFLAFLPEAEQEEYLSHVSLEKLTRDTVTDVRALRRELDRIRQDGYATSFGERMEGAAAVAAPLFGMSDGRPLAVISICGPADRFRAEVKDCAGLLIEATRRASAQMGYLAS